MTEAVYILSTSKYECRAHLLSESLPGLGEALAVAPGTRWGVGRRSWDSVGRRASLLGLGGASAVAPGIR